MAVASMSTVQLGSALTVPLFGRLGALGAAGLRLGWAGVLLLILVRPRRRDFTRRDLSACTVLGAVTAAMMLFFMLALARLPLGTASALEFLGPLAVSLYGPGRGRAVWTAAAATGVALLTEPWHGGLDPLGAGYALAAAACWAAYILLAQRTAGRFRGGEGLALAALVAALIPIVPGVVEGGGDLLSPEILALGLCVAVLSSVIPYSLETVALRRMPAHLFGVLMSLEPVVAAIAGLVVLGQHLGAADLVAIGLVVAASIGATQSARTAVPVDLQ
jgi:inner membrane transporter RhtA